MMGLDKMEEKLPVLQKPADKRTRAAVSGGLSTVMGTRLGQMASSGVGLALSRSESWVEHNLPLSERELGQ
ncbi:hypothetical protein CRUP_015469 [Coryphaenoides rupestris]|nr:hypothetical protein CRUP_015469 [Coryphaenoides rupestris]